MSGGSGSTQRESHWEIVTKRLKEVEDRMNELVSRACSFKNQMVGNVPDDSPASIGEGNAKPGATCFKDEMLNLVLRLEHQLNVINRQLDELA